MQIFYNAMPTINEFKDENQKESEQINSQENDAH